jgi:PAS domain S-box-containing protein
MPTILTRPPGLAAEPLQPTALASMTRIVVSIVAVIFVGDFFIQSAAERWWLHRPVPWLTVFVEDCALSAVCAAFLLPLLRRWQRRARVAERAMDIASDGFLVADDAGHVIGVNDGYCEITGLDRDSLLGRKLVDLQLHDAEPPAADMLAEVRSAGVGRCDLRHHGAEGQPVHVQMTTAYLADLACYAAFVRDDTERVSARAALADSMRRLRNIFELAPVGMMTTGLDGRFLQVNGALCSMLGRGSESLLALRWQDVTVPEDHAVKEDKVQSMLAGAAGQHTFELRYLHRDGNEVWALAALALVRDEAGRSDYLICVAKDISERKRAQAALQAGEVAQRANAAKTQFLSRISHELRTPLNAVLGYAQLLRLDPAHPLQPTQGQYVERIEQAGAHLLDLINDVLDLSSIEGGHLRVNIKTTQLHSLALESITMLSAEAAAAGVALILGESAAPVRAQVQADGVRLKQILLNLLSNAIKYNRRGGTVVLDWKRDGPRWAVQVADTGQGMQAQQLAHLFEPFNRLGAEHSSVEGSGIGLALSRQLAELMAGQMSVSSTPGMGTVVTLTLPATHADEPMHPRENPSPASPASTAAGPKLRVMYVEDNLVNIELLRAFLQAAEGIELRVATSGAEACAMAWADPPDLMLMDMNLGDTTGQELAKVLRADPRTSGLRLVALSADAMPEQVEQARQAGFEAYLTKPIQIERLLRVLLGSEAG